MMNLKKHFKSIRYLFVLIVVAAVLPMSSGAADEDAGAGLPICEDVQFTMLKPDDYPDGVHNIYFAWTPHTGAAAYHLRVSPEAVWAPLGYYATEPNMTVLASDLSIAGDYVALVVAVDANGQELCQTMPDKDTPDATSGYFNVRRIYSAPFVPYIVSSPEGPPPPGCTYVRVVLVNSPSGLTVTPDGKYGYSHATPNDYDGSALGMICGLTVYGNDNSNSVKGTSGNDTVYGYGGNDGFHGGDGNDTFDGGNGNDAFWGEGGNDTFDGGSGNDAFWGEGGNDTFDGGGGNDAFWGGDGNDTFAGGSGNDVFWGDAGYDEVTDGQVETCFSSVEVCP